MCFGPRPRSGPGGRSAARARRRAPPSDLCLRVAVRRRRVDLREVDARAGTDAERAVRRIGAGHRLSSAGRSGGQDDMTIRPAGAARMTTDRPAPSPIRSSSPAAGSSRDDPLVVANPADPDQPGRRDVPRDRGAVRGGGRGRRRRVRGDPDAARLRARRDPARTSAPGSRPAARSSAGSSRSRPASRSATRSSRSTGRSLTFRLGAEEAERMVGETIPLDLMPASKGRVGHHAPLPDRPDRRRSARSTSR